jgi:hypothetical protein
MLEFIAQMFWGVPGADGGCNFRVKLLWIFGSFSDELRVLFYHFGCMKKRIHSTSIFEDRVVPVIGGNLWSFHRSKMAAPDDVKLILLMMNQTQNS